MGIYRKVKNHQTDYIVALPWQKIGQTKNMFYKDKL